MRALLLAFVCSTVAAQDYGQHPSSAAVAEIAGTFYKDKVGTYLQHTTPVQCYEYPTGYGWCIRVVIRHYPLPHQPLETQREVHNIFIRDGKFHEYFDGSAWLY